MQMISAQAEKSLRRQNESLLAVAQEMAKNEGERGGDGSPAAG